MDGMIPPKSHRPGMPLGDMATQSPEAVDIRGGRIQKISDLHCFKLRTVTVEEGTWNAGPVNANGTVGSFGEDDEDAQLFAHGYGIGPTVHGYRANGTRNAPVAVTKGSLVLGTGARAYDGSRYQDHSAAAIHWVAAEDQAPGSWGMLMRFLVTPVGDDERTTPLVLTPNGTVWGKDGNTSLDDTNTAHTKPWADARFLATGGSAGVSMSVVGYAYNAGFRGGQCGGTVAAPTATPSGAYLTFLGGMGYDTTNGWAGSSALFGLMATENRTSTAHGTKAVVETTPNGSTTRRTVAEFGQDGKLTLTYGQIQFPASKNASADLNCLDDYEENTAGWSAAVTGSNDVAVSADTVRQEDYTVVGNRCFFTIDAECTTVGGGATGQLRVTLPFTAAGSHVATGARIDAGYTSCYGFIYSGTNKMDILSYDGASLLVDGRRVIVSGSFMV